MALQAAPEGEEGLPVGEFVTGLVVAVRAMIQ